MTNLLPTWTFFEILGFHPYHAYGIAGTGDLKVQTGCDTLVRRYEWQNSDAVGMLAIEQAIETAETKLRQYLGYSVAPHYVSEVVQWPAGGNAWGSDGRWLSMQLMEGEVRAVGVETVAAIQVAAAVAYSDEDSDGINDTFSISAASALTDASEIAVYFSVADRFNGFGATTAIGDRWRVRPVTVMIAGGTITVKGPRQLCVKPIKYEGVVNIGASGLDPAHASTDFVTTLDLYQRTTATDGNTVATSQAVVTWETRPSHGWWCCCDGCTAASYSGSIADVASTAQAVARVGIRDARHGLITPAAELYDSAGQTWSAQWPVCETPDRVTVRYLAGFPLGSDGQMQEPFRTLVARMAMAELARPVCGCDAANRELYYWQYDISVTGRTDELYGISPENLNNPFGTRRGHVYAWKAVQNLRQLTGILA